MKSIDIQHKAREIGICVCATRLAPLLMAVFPTVICEAGSY